MQIATGVWLVDGVRASHVYLVAVPGGVVVVDSGIPGSGAAIEAELRRSGYSASQVTAVVVTHAHIDHIGSLARLQQATGAPVLAADGEADAIEGISALPAPPGVWGVPLRLLNSRFRPAPVPVARRLDANAMLPEMPGWLVVATPGHTPAHISLYHPQHQLLIAGDALANLGTVGGAPRVLNSDTRLANASVALLAGLPVRTAMFGHGEPIIDDPRLTQHIAAAATKLR